MNAFRRLRSGWILWVFAAALLLKAGVPFLARASADLQGKTVAEVCTVYGVVQMPMDDGEPAPAGSHGPATSAEHCALGGLPTLGQALAADIAVAAGPEAPDAVLPAAAPGNGRAHACATWVARLKHGPPDRA